MSEIVLQVGVKVLLKNSQNKFLLLRRNPKKYPEVGPKWDIVGGRINPGSNLLDNLKREVLEETGLVLSAIPKLVGAQDILKVEGKHIVRLTYIGKIEGEVKIDEESMEFGWFTEQEILKIEPENIDSYFKELVDKGLIFS